MITRLVRFLLPMARRDLSCCSFGTAAEATHQSSNTADLEIDESLVMCPVDGKRRDGIPVQDAIDLLLHSALKPKTVRALAASLLQTLRQARKRVCSTF